MADGRDGSVSSRPVPAPSRTTSGAFRSASRIDVTAVRERGGKKSEGERAKGKTTRRGKVFLKHPPPPSLSLSPERFRKWRPTFALLALHTGSCSLFHASGPWRWGLDREGKDYVSHNPAGEERDRRERIGREGGRFRLSSSFPPPSLHPSPAPRLLLLRRVRERERASGAGRESGLPGQREGGG